MGNQLGFYLNVDRCVQCHACEIACKSHKNIEHGITLRQVIGVWAGQYPNLIHRTISFSCMHCGEPDCVDACPNKAITKREEDGIVVVDRDECSGCGECADACPYGVIQFDQEGIMQKCDLCVDRLVQGKQPICVETCPSEALQFGSIEGFSKQPLVQQLAGANYPSMMISCYWWTILEPLLPWK